MAKLPKSAAGKSSQLKRVKTHMGAMTPKERANLPRAQEQIAYDDLVHGKGTITPKKKPQMITSREPLIDRLDQERRLVEHKKPRRRY